MKTKIVFFACLVILSAALGAQTVHDPNSEIYRDIDRWFIQGYITGFLPMIRPYPAVLLKKYLEQVIENGDSQAQVTAARYKDLLSRDSRSINPGISGFAQGNEEDRALMISPFAEGSFYVNDNLNVSYNITIHALSDELNGERFNVPGTYSPYPDLIDDTADIGPFNILQNWTSLLALGDSNVYLQAGLSRSSVGPFYDNSIVIGPQAPRAGHFSFNYRETKYSFEMLFQTLVPTDDFGQGRFTSKYSIIHALNFYPLENLELGIIQTLIYGERIDPLYFVPFTFLFGAQTVNGFQDNALIGLNFRWKPFNTFLLSGQVYIDDFSFNGLLSGSPHFKAAGMLGFSWAPKNNFLSRLDFDYTAVMPYMYTHWPEPETNRYNGPQDPSDPKSLPIGDREPRIPNYLNYTHMGRNLGPDLPPNSDRFSVRSSFRFIQNLDIRLAAYLKRHGNASEGRAFFDHCEEQNFHDGSIFDYGSIDPWTPGPHVWGDHTMNNFYKDIPFLSQSVIETKLGVTLGITWTIPSSSFGIFRLMLDYGIQYGWNRSTVTNRRPQKDNNGLEHFWSIGGMWSY